MGTQFKAILIVLIRALSAGEVFRFMADKRISHPRTRLLFRQRRSADRRTAVIQHRTEDVARELTFADQGFMPRPNDWSRPPQSGATAVAVPKLMASPSEHCLHRGRHHPIVELIDGVNAFDIGRIMADFRR